MLTRRTRCTHLLATAVSKPSSRRDLTRLFSSVSCVRTLAIVALVCAPALTGAGCSSTKTADQPIAAEGAVARFTLGAPNGDAPPAFMDVPFPSDVYIGANGKVVNPVPGIEAVFKQGTNYLSHELGKANGFSRIAMAMFYVDDPTVPADSNGEVAHADVDPASLPTDEATCSSDTSAVYFVDLEVTDGSDARIPCRSFFHDDTHHLSKTRPVVTVGPARGILLAEGHKYAAVLTSRVKTKKGKAIGASQDFAKVMDPTARTGTVLTAYGAAYDKVAAALKSALDTDKASIVAIAPYTTNNQTQELFKLRESLEDQPPPALTWDAASVAPMGATRFARTQNGALPAGFTASLDAWLGVADPTAKLPDGSDDPDVDLPVRAHDKIDAVGTAVFVANNYLVSKPGSYQEVDHATFAYDASGNIIPAPDKPTTKIWVTVITPTAAMPPAGYPTVIVQHGLSGSRAYLLDLGNVLADKGWMVVGIDSVTFGARAPEANLQTDTATDYEAAPGATYKGPDGLSDPVNKSRNGSSDLFGGLQNIGAIRDQFRASGVDTAQLVRVLRSNPDLSPMKTGTVVPKIDPSNIAYMGDSLGAMEGIIAAAIEPNVKSWFLNVVGGGLFTELASHSPTISFQLAAAGGLFFGFNGDYFSESQPFVTMCQHLVDGGDPLSYAPYLVKSPGTFKGVVNAKKNILQTQVLFDEIVSNEANEAFMRAANIGLASPNVGSNSGILDLTSPATNPSRIPLTMLSADASGAFHDTPETGITAVAVQLSPAAHGIDIVGAKGGHQFAIPFARFNTSEAFTRLDAAKQFTVNEDYRGVEEMMTRFFADSFAGKAPTVSGFKTPIRDYDGDGATDESDADPSDPTVK